MEQQKKNSKIVIIFISAAIAAFLILSLIVFILPYSQRLADGSKYRENNVDYGVKSKHTKDDPFITPVPRLEDYIDSPIDSGNDPEKGNDNALVTIVYFSDYSCAFCSKQEKVINKIYDDYAGQVRIIWKDYPDINSPKSYEGALAARCAQAQGMFWPYHDRILLAQEKGNDDIDYLSIANGLELDNGLFQKCIEEDTASELIKDNIEEAGLLSITGIPFTYVNNRGFLGELSYEDIKQLVDFELASLEEK
jgi:protein-disulfide isomerase